MSHTPGPWTVFGKHLVGIDLGPVNSLGIADCKTSFASEEQEQANARLIAAAPDLLGAAEQALQHWDMASRSALRAAVAKAKTLPT